MPQRKCVGVLGATSHVGSALLPILQAADFDVTAVSRRAFTAEPHNIRWLDAQSLISDIDIGEVSYWICLAPVWVLPDYFAIFQASKTKRIVVLSSTSRFTKQDSLDLSDQALAQRLTKSEHDLLGWARRTGIECVILRPTLIYGLGRDKNICEIARLIRRLGFFPLMGGGKGLRQPVHCSDVAKACVAALSAENAASQSYNLSGAEVLSYKDMVARIFNGMGLKPRFVEIPMFLIRIGFVVLKILPRYRSWSFSMMERTNHDLIFDHDDASRDLDYYPRQFRLEPEDLEMMIKN